MLLPSLLALAAVAAEPLDQARLAPSLVGEHHFAVVMTPGPVEVGRWTVQVAEGRKRGTWAVDATLRMELGPMFMERAARLVLDADLALREGTVTESGTDQPTRTSTWARTGRKLSYRVDVDGEVRTAKVRAPHDERGTLEARVLLASALAGGQDGAVTLHALQWPDGADAPGWSTSELTVDGTTDATLLPEEALRMAWIQGESMRVLVDGDGRVRELAPTDGAPLRIVACDDPTCDLPERPEDPQVAGVKDAFLGLMTASGAAEPGEALDAVVDWDALVDGAEGEVSRDDARAALVLAMGSIPPEAHQLAPVLRAMVQVTVEGEVARLVAPSAPGAAFVFGRGVDGAWRLVGIERELPR